MQPHNLPVYAVSAGTVRVIYKNADPDQACIWIEHKAANPTTGVIASFWAVYGHTSPQPGLVVGGHVNGGDVIGKTMYFPSAGDHCHFGINIAGSFLNALTYKIGYFNKAHQDKSFNAVIGWGRGGSLPADWATYKSANRPRLETRGFVDPLAFIRSFVPAELYSVPWTQLTGYTDHPVATSDTDGLLYFFRAGADMAPYYTWMVENESYVPTWKQTRGATSFGPTSAANFSNVDDARYFAFLGTDNQIYVDRVTGKESNTVLSNWQWLAPASSAKSPSMATVGDKLYEFNRGGGSDLNMYLYMVDLYRRDWSYGNGTVTRLYPNWSLQVYGATREAPAVTQFAGNLWGAHVGTDDHIYVANLSSYIRNPQGNPWQWSGASSLTAPSMVEWRGRLFMAYRRYDTGHLELISTDGKGNWQLEQSFSESSNMTPTVFTFYDRLYMLFVRSDGTIWFKRIRS